MHPVVGYALLGYLGLYLVHLFYSIASTYPGDALRIALIFVVVPYTLYNCLPLSMFPEMSVTLYIVCMMFVLLHVNS
jgi:hypothetical protein